MAEPVPPRVFLLSPASASGRRAQILLREGAGFPNLHRTVKEVNADIHSFYTVSPERQILAVLTETELNSDLVFAFLTVVIRSGSGALTQAKNELIT